jgi:hypothetical protein
VHHALELKLIALVVLEIKFYLIKMCALVRQAPTLLIIIVLLALITALPVKMQPFAPAVKKEW